MAASALSENAKPMSGRMPVLAIVGGGCAGTLLAASLLRRPGGPLRIVMIERGDRFGPGVAYATDDPQHLLNVPAHGMSAFGDAPLHFADWAANRLGAGAGRESYLPRGVYGSYLQAVLAASQARARPGRTLELLRGEVLGLDRPADTRLELLLADGTRLACEQAVLATGPVEPATVAQLPNDPRIVTNPWAPGAWWQSNDTLGVRGRPKGLMLVLGTGLSAVDLALSTCATQRRVLALSRGGRLPHAHLPGPRTPAPHPRSRGRRPRSPGWRSSYASTCSAWKAAAMTGATAWTGCAV